jgi:hypothetical protein
MVLTRYSGAPMQLRSDLQMESGDVDTTPPPPIVEEESSPLMGILLLVGAGFGGYYAGEYFAKGKSSDDATMYKYGGAAAGVLGLYLFARAKQNGGV